MRRVLVILVITSGIIVGGKSRCFLRLFLNVFVVQIARITISTLLPALPYPDFTANLHGYALLTHTPHNTSMKNILFQQLRITDYILFNSNIHNTKLHYYLHDISKNFQFIFNYLQSYLILTFLSFIIRSNFNQLILQILYLIILFD